ncbi:hypothetical protein HYE69_02460 [Staphylococcus sp. GSSP0090]|nr:hypothetical protein [Staphylococcus sp. GSSP0090]
MWISLHIYNYSYINFIKKVEELIPIFEDENCLFFYTVYSDINGPHFRLRIKISKSNKRVFNSVFSKFDKKNIKEKIYDREIIKYRDNIDLYEEISSSFCKYIIKNIALIENQKTIFCLSTIVFFTKFFKIDETEYYFKAMNFWANSFKYFNRSIEPTIDIYNSIQIVYENHFEYFNQLEELLRKLTITSDDMKKELAFHFSHMIINRLNLSPKDEVLLYAMLINEKEPLK